MMMGEVVVDLLQPKLMANIVNKVVETGVTGEVDPEVMSFILFTALKMILLVAFGGFCGVMCCYTASVASQGFGSDIRVDAFNKVMSLSLEQTDRFTTGSLVTRLTNDITTLQDFVMMILRMFVRAPIFFIMGIAMCLTLNVNFGIVAFVALPLVLIIVLIMVIKAVPIFTVVQEKLDRVNSVVQESVTGARVVKAYTREDHEIARFETANLDFQRTNLRVSYIMSAIFPAMSLVMNGSVIAIIYIGGLQVQARAVNVGDVMAAAQYITQVLSSVMMMSFMFQQVARSKACAARIREVLEADPTIKSGETSDASEIGTVRFENVSFRYPGASGDNVLDNISFEVKKGETVAVIGATGSGKSSLVNLIPRFYDTTDGDVFVDGVNVRDWDLHALRSRIGFVLQKSELFSGTVDENIRWGKTDAEMDEIVEAAKIAQADEFISKMEEGYTSYVAERGASLSGGQKQRIAITRAVLRHPEIIIFDDSTSALDLSTEAKLRQALGREFGDTTVIMIAQRIASVMHADRIAVIENGKITAFDSHDNLMKTSAAYRDIYSSQMKNNEGGAD
ncbi:MAG: ABC transporter ATP-binding protein [Ruminococcaceae bacterium]|nr:ABC transporter ATP-binding protein [Oscillospiraceae bacterium]